MPFPVPEPGLVISYAYLWRYEAHKGHREGRKTRPCLIILAVEDQGEDKIVTVAPMTHKAPEIKQTALEIPMKVKRHLGLDAERSWVVLDEVNQFVWPGYDLRAVPGHSSRYDYGFIPPRLFEMIKKGIIATFLARRGKKVDRR